MEGGSGEVNDAEVKLAGLEEEYWTVELMRVRVKAKVKNEVTKSSQRLWELEKEEVTTPFYL